MIVNPPRSEAELSPRLKAISIHAADQFEYPNDVAPLIPWRISRRLLVPLLLVLAGVVFRLGIWGVVVIRDQPSVHCYTAEMFRTQAANAEQEAKDYRAIAVSGKTGTIPRFGTPIDPVTAKQMADGWDQQAAFLRQQAYIQERLNQGLPIR